MACILSYARLSITFTTLSAKLSPCVKYVTFSGDILEIWQTQQHQLPSFATWTRLEQFMPGITSTAVLSWSPDSTRIAIGISSGTVWVYFIAQGQQGASETLSPYVHKCYRDIALQLWAYFSPVFVDSLHCLTVALFCVGGYDIMAICPITLLNNSHLLIRTENIFAGNSPYRSVQSLQLDTL